jgi:DNA-binding NtrC family response regulator
MGEWKGILPVNGDVVIVEDDPVLRSLMTDILKGIRANCVSFETADDALMHVLESHGHCALLIADHGVPGQIQGTELVSMVRARWPEIPVILTSGYFLPPESLPEGVVYLQKPWDIDVLINTIAELLQPGVPVSRF